MDKPEVLHFTDNGLTPNSSLTVLIYRDITKGDKKDTSNYLEELFRSNNWTNNWRDIVLSKNHYHSTTHEVLGIGNGRVSLWLGGKGGREVIASEGDVIIIPAGVGHYSYKSNEDYIVVGGYPNGLDWDMIYDEPEKYQTAKKRISQIDIPNTDPVYGSGGFLISFWK